MAVPVRLSKLHPQGAVLMLRNAPLMPVRDTAPAERRPAEEAIIDPMPFQPLAPARDRPDIDAALVAAVATSNADPCAHAGPARTGHATVFAFSDAAEAMPPIDEQHRSALKPVRRSARALGIASAAAPTHDIFCDRG